MKVLRACKSPPRRCTRATGNLLVLLAIATAGWGAAPGLAQGFTDRYSAADQAYAQRDYGTAHTIWIELATEGNSTAYFNLGRLYMFGEGVRIDLVESFKWFEMAKRAGLPRSTAGLARLTPLMTPTDIEEAQRRIERWYTTYPKTRR